MSAASGVLAMQADALINQLRRDEVAACEREGRQAEERAEVIVATAHREARKLVADAIAAERTRRQSELQRARASIDTARRQALQRAAASAVREGWKALPEALRRLWREPGARQAWEAAALAGAARRLPLDRWQIECAAPADAARLQQLCDIARAHGVRDVQAIAAEGLVAGVAVRCDRAVFDATVGGLLSEDMMIQARLHALWLSESPA